MILREALNYAGRLYMPGDNVKGKLPLDLIQRLKDNGRFVDPEEGEIPESQEKAPEGGSAADNPPGEGTEPPAGGSGGEEGAGDESMNLLPPISTPIETSDSILDGILSGASLKLLEPGEFGELIASEQKSKLKGLGIDPAGREEERVAQYEEWYEEQIEAAYNGEE